MKKTIVLVFIATSFLNASAQIINLKSYLIYAGKQGSFDNKGVLEVSCSPTSKTYYKPDFHLPEVDLYNYNYQLTFYNVSNNSVKVSVSDGYVYSRHAPDVNTFGTGYSLAGGRKFFELPPGDSKSLSLSFIDDWYPITKEGYDEVVQKSKSAWEPYWVRINVGYLQIIEKEKKTGDLAELENDLLEEIEEIDKEVEKVQSKSTSQIPSEHGSERNGNKSASHKSHTGNHLYDPLLCQQITSNYRSVLFRLNEQTSLLTASNPNLDYVMAESQLIQSELEITLKDLNGLIAKGQLSPECVEQIQAIAEEFSDAYMKKMEGVLEDQNSGLSPYPSSNSHFKSLMAPSIMTPAFKSSTPSMKPDNFAPAKLKHQGGGI